MSEIVLTEEQARILAAADKTVVVRDPKGATVGVLDPREAAIIAEAKRRLTSPGPRYTGAHIQARLQALQAEQDRIGRFDADYAKAFSTHLEQSDRARYGPKEEA